MAQSEPKVTFSGFFFDDEKAFKATAKEILQRLMDTRSAAGAEVYRVGYKELYLNQCAFKLCEGISGPRPRLIGREELPPGFVKLFPATSRRPHKRPRKRHI